MAWLRSMSCGAVWNVVMRALKIAGAATAAVIVVLALLLIIGIPSSFLTAEIQARVERETGYRLTISGGTKTGLWPKLNVTLTDVTLENPKDPETSNRLTVGRVQADVTLASLWSGHPQITELTIVRPVLHHPLLRERTRVPSPPARPTTSSSEHDSNALAIDRVTVTDGTVVAFNLRDRVENRITGINAVATIEDRKIRLTGNARASEPPLKFEIKATAPRPPVERQNMPVELALDAPGVLQAPLSAKAEVRLNGSVVMINGVTGTLGDDAFNGWASVDIESKPLVKVDLDFQRLGVATSKAPATSASTGAQPWSNATIDLNGLNYVDALVRISAAELNLGDTRFAPVAIDVALAGGVLRCGFPNLGAYGGQVSGQLIVDASRGQPIYALTSDLNLIGPLVKMTGAGTVDLAAKSLALRVEPKLVMTTEGQGRAGDPVGLGIPVVIDGPWSEPRIYPEMAGILDNPDAAYAKLKEMGKGLFAPGGGLSSALGGLGGSGGSGGSGSGDSGQSGQLGKLGETLG